jgi:hypothetical protein
MAGAHQVVESLQVLRYEVGQVRVVLRWRDGACAQGACAKGRQ